MGAVSKRNGSLCGNAIISQVSSLFGTRFNEIEVCVVMLYFMGILLKKYLGHYL